MGKTLVAAVIVILACALPVFSYGQDKHPASSSSASQSPGTAPAGDEVVIAQGEAEELSHQALATAVQATDLFYVVSASGTLPVLDSTFRDFVDYGAMVSFGAGKRVTEKLSITATIGVGMMTGDWSVSGDRQSILVAAEEYYPGYISGPGTGIIITPEDLPDANLGISYHGEAEAVIISSEALKNIDVHTDLYLFPVALNARYQITQKGTFDMYAGGGLGFCVATRDCDSRAIKEKYYFGPDYKATLNDSQTVTGLLVNLVAGMNMPVYDRIRFVAEASATLYDLKAFDPVLEISFTRPNPAWYQGSDLSQWSYEDPLRVGVYDEVYVANLSAGFVIPF
ncbi:MAG TPA: hypothetical protein PLT33_11235 [Deltaproteobacteria bacterium]|nr:hypothetical protein [Deltaproteobacteria bacterium]HPA76539.1 hypothetical protein [Deltaproteobacteria bacterium]HQO61430.1 hypothetical protein [Deltaproteobacteria bacterium]